MMFKKIPIGNYSTLAEQFKLQRSAGELDSAVIVGTEWIQVCDACFGRKDLRAIEARKQLGQLYLELGNFLRSGTLFSEALSDATDLVGLKSPLSVMLLCWVACTKLKQAKNFEAYELYSQALEISAHDLRRADDEMLPHFRNLVGLCLRLSKFEEGIMNVEFLIELSESRLGKSHPELAQDRYLYALLLIKKDLNLEALEQFKLACEIGEGVWKDPNPSQWTYLRDLATCYGVVGKLQESVDTFLRAQAIELTTKGIDPIESAILKLEFAKTLVEMGELESAKDLLVKAKDAFSTRLGVENPLYLECEQGLKQIAARASIL